MEMISLIYTSIQRNLNRYKNIKWVLKQIGRGCEVNLGL